MPRNNESRVRSINYWDRCFIWPNPGLRSYFGSVERGQSKIYDTPFAKGESTETLLSEWDKVLVSISDRWPTLYQFESEKRAKVGPMSVMKPLNQRLGDIDAYYDGIQLPSEPISQSAVAAVRHELIPIQGLMIRDQRKTVELMKKSTNSGSPYFTKRRNVVDETIPCGTFVSGMDVKQYLNVSSGDTKYMSACAVLGWRGQEGGPLPADVKQRVVWMFPFAVNINELQVYQPLIEGVQRFNIFPAWVSMDAVDQVITKLFDTKGDNDLVVCTDFSKFDQHFNSSLQDAARQLLQYTFKGDKSMRDWLNEIYPIKYMIPLAYDYGKVRRGLHGMGSGSGGTNADETLAHRCLQFEAAQTKGVLLNPNSMCLGDDGILSYPGIHVEDVVASYTRHGLIMNEDKQYASTQDCTFLQRWHHKDYRIAGICARVYPTMRALGRLRYLERYMDPEVWSPKAVALRQLSILENVKYHPLRDQFAEFCMKRDKYRLGIDIPGFLDNIEAEVEKHMELMPGFLGYVQSMQLENSGIAGIKNWWIVNYLKSKI